MAEQRPAWRSRSRTASRQEEPTDKVATALTLQIIVCLVLLLVAGILSKTRLPQYMQLQETVGILASDTSQNAALWQSITNARPLEAMENALDFLLGPLQRKLGGESSITTPPESEAPAENAEEVPEAKETFSYNYLLPQPAAVSKAPLGGQGGWFPVIGSSKKGLTVPSGSTLSPVAFTAEARPPLLGRITSFFSFRDHPITGTQDFHTGIDIAAPEGASILAAWPGEVIEVGQSNIYGNYIVLEHSPSLKTSYSHCSRILAEEGMILRQGERIALVGSTGISTGPHLHFSVMIDDVFVDPGWALSSNIRPVNTGQ